MANQYGCASNLWLALMRLQFLQTWFCQRRLRFDVRELSGAFGDLGTDLPLLTGMVFAGNLDAGWAFLLFGVLQIASGIIYGLPMPVQPLKAVAALVIVQGISGPVIAGGAFAIALIMLLLTVSGCIDGLARLTPKPVIRGIQLGLGIKLGMLAFGNYMQADGMAGLILAAISFLILFLFSRQRRFPAPVVVLILGAVYALACGVDLGAFRSPVLIVPAPSFPSGRDIWLGLILLALPQVPLSLGNSMLATKQLADDWFPGQGVTLRRIGVTYSVFNFIVAFFGGIPVCHGSGGMAGHYAFGGRTGGSVVIYGAFYIVVGLLHACRFDQITALFPLPILGVILFIEALTLASRLQDVVADRADLLMAIVVGVAAVGLPYGFLTGMVIGIALAALRRRLRVSIPLPEPDQP